MLNEEPEILLQHPPIMTLFSAKVQEQTELIIAASQELLQILLPLPPIIVDLLEQAVKALLFPPITFDSKVPDKVFEVPIQIPLLPSSN